MSSGDERQDLAADKAETERKWQAVHPPYESDEDDVLGQGGGGTDDISDAQTDWPHHRPAAPGFHRIPGEPAFPNDPVNALDPVAAIDPAHNPDGVYVRQPDGSWTYIGDKDAVDFASLTPPFTVALGRSFSGRENGPLMQYTDYGDMNLSEEYKEARDLMTPDSPKTQIQVMLAEVSEFLDAKGWNEQRVSFGEAMALLHSEVSEALEAYREHGLADATAPRAKNRERLDSEIGRDPKPEGVGSEFADIFIRLLDDCQRFGINLEDEYRRKMDYNWTRSHRHGGKRL
jgi:NTP pyrophosphatase (non-canonical NTP hydrolase)